MKDEASPERTELLRDEMVAAGLQVVNGVTPVSRRFLAVMVLVDRCASSETFRVSSSEQIVRSLRGIIGEIEAIEEAAVKFFIAAATLAECLAVRVNEPGSSYPSSSHVN